MFDGNYVTQKNSYMQLLAPLCVVQPLIRDLCQTFTERFVKPVGVRDFSDAKMSMPLPY